jgi:hypothetical protein
MITVAFKSADVDPVDSAELQAAAHSTELLNVCEKQDLT